MPNRPVVANRSSNERMGPGAPAQVCASAAPSVPPRASLRCGRSRVKTLMSGLVADLAIHDGEQASQAADAVRRNGQIIV